MRPLLGHLSYYLAGFTSAGRKAVGVRASLPAISGGGNLSQAVQDGWAAGSQDPGNTVVGDFESP